jgi:hypothetical protein
MGFDALSQKRQIHPSPVPGFCRIGIGLTIVDTGADMVELVLDKTAPNLGGIGETENLPKWAVETHFVLESPVRGIQHGLPDQWMAAAGVGPEIRGVIFTGRSTLQQQFKVVIEHEDGKGTMQQATPVGLEFFHAAGYTILVVDQNDFINHLYSAVRVQSIPIMRFFQYRCQRNPLYCFGVA